MSEVTRLLSAIEAGDQFASEELLPLVYAELRRVAGRRLADQPPGGTLQPTALVHEAFVRLVDAEQPQRWNNRGHFFVAAAEAMRRIVVESVRRKQSLKQGGAHERRDVEIAEIAIPDAPCDLIALSEALDRLAEVDHAAAEVVKLRYFTGLTIPEAAEALDTSVRTANRLWAYARAWLLRELGS